jgi:hypothetical protein
MPDSELQSLHVSPDQIRRTASELGIQWYQLPIPDAGTPEEGFEHLWGTLLVSSGFPERLNQIRSSPLGCNPSLLFFVAMGLGQS